MGTERIVVSGEEVVTLVELLRPGLRAVFVGINPAPKSVAAGHYYHGPHGRIFWGLLQRYKITTLLPKGQEDLSAFEEGFGFADLVRFPTKAASDISMNEKRAGIEDLTSRLKALGDYPVIAFRYSEAWRLAGPRLEEAGFTIVRLPGSYDPFDKVENRMNQFRHAIG